MFYHCILILHMYIRQSSLKSHFQNAPDKVSNSYVYHKTSEQQMPTMETEDHVRTMDSATTVSCVGQLSILTFSHSKRRQWVNT